MCRLGRISRILNRLSRLPWLILLRTPLRATWLSRIRLSRIRLPRNLARLHRIRIRRGGRIRIWLPWNRLPVRRLSVGRLSRLAGLNRLARDS